MPMHKVKNPYCLTTLAFSLAITVSACGKKADTPTTGTPTAEAAPKAGAPAPVPQVPKDDKASYTAEAYRAAAKDQSFPVSKHAEKTVEVTGVVKYYDHGRSQGMASVQAGPAGELFADISLRVAGRQPWLKALPGQTATFRTVIPKSVRDRDDIEWEIVEVKGAPTRTVTAEQIARENRDNFKEASEKYFQKPVIVTGTVAEVLPPGEGGTKILVGSGKDTVTVAFSPADQAAANLTPAQKSALKPGTKVKVLGVFLGELGDAILLDPAP